MINFIQNSAHLIKEAHGIYSANCGAMTAPRGGNNMQNAADLGMPWIMDNDCFNRYDPPAIVKMLKKNRGIKGCLFMVAPDVVCDHELTLLLFRAWLGTIQNYGYPVAFVIQNGATIESIPWDSISAIFIGGDDKFKFLRSTATIALEAKKRGKWVHMGRVNTEDRLQRLYRPPYRYMRFKSLVDSFDGTAYSKHMKTYVPKHLRFYADNWQIPNQLKLSEDL